MTMLGYTFRNDPRVAMAPSQYGWAQADLAREMVAGALPKKIDRTGRQSAALQRTLGGGPVASVVAPAGGDGADAGVVGAGVPDLPTFGNNGFGSAPGGVALAGDGDVFGFPEGAAVSENLGDGFGDDLGGVFVEGADVVSGIAGPSLGLLTPAAVVLGDLANMAVPSAVWGQDEPEGEIVEIEPLKPGEWRWG